MQYNDLVGSLGVGIILLAYGLNSFDRLPKNGRLFFALNIIGAGLACYASLLIHYKPFVILEGVWTLVSILAFIKTFNRVP